MMAQTSSDNKKVARMFIQAMALESLSAANFESIIPAKL